jgi:hypothetical protein
MMRWDLILPGIGNLLGRLTGLQQFERDSPAKLTDTRLKAKLEFAVTACTSVGRDERRYVYDGTVTDPNARVKLTITGVRQFTLSVKCVSYDHSPMMAAEWHLERIYTRLSWPSSQQALNALGVSWTGAGTFTNLSTIQKAEDRVFSLGQKDLFFTALVEDSTPPVAGYLGDSPIGTIDQVILTSVYLYGPDGQQLGKQIGPTTIG